MTDCHPWWHCSFSKWQPVVSRGKTQLVSWQLFVFNVACSIALFSFRHMIIMALKWHSYCKIWAMYSSITVESVWWLLMAWCVLDTRLCFYQTRSAWSMDQGSNRKHSAFHNFAPTVTKFCVMWEGQALPHNTKFSNCRCEIVGRRVIFISSLIPGSSWSGLIKAEPGHQQPLWWCKAIRVCKEFPNCDVTKFLVWCKFIGNNFLLKILWLSAQTCTSKPHILWVKKISSNTMILRLNMDDAEIRYVLQFCWITCALVPERR